MICQKNRNRIPSPDPVSPGSLKRFFSGLPEDETLISKALAQLSEKGWKPDTTGRSGNTALIIAVQMNRPVLARMLLLKGSDPDSTDALGLSAVTHAVHRNCSGLCRLLLENGARCSLEMITSSPVPVCKSITEAIAENCGLPVPGKAGPLLFKASGSGQLELSRILLDHGADPDWRDGQERTPLMHAARNGHTSLVSLLLSHGADPIARDCRGNSAFISAGARGYHEIRDMLSPFEQKERERVRRIRKEQIRKRNRAQEELRRRIWEEEMQRRKADRAASIPGTGESLYEQLELTPDATFEQIRDMYKKKIRECHPDRFSDQPQWVRLEADRRTKALNRAYEILGDREKRADYDRLINSGLNRGI